MTSDWTVKANGTFIELTIKVSNLGSADAQGVYVRAGLDTGNDTWWNSKNSQTANVSVDGIVTYTIYLTPPSSGKHTRLEVEVIYNGHPVDISYSKWFDT